MQINQHAKSIYIWYGCIVLILTALLFYINTGIELRDEGFYLQGYRRQQPIYFSHSGFQFLVRLLPFSDDIIIARLWRIALHIVAALAMAGSLHKYAIQQISFMHLAAYALFGSFLSYVFAPLSISYNSLNLILLQLLLAVYLVFRAKPFSFSSSTFGPITIFGILLGLLAYNKVTSAAFVTMLLCIDQLLLRFSEKKQLFSVISLIGLVSFTVFASCIYCTFDRDFLIGIFQGTKSYNPFYIDQNNPAFLLKQLFVNPVVDSRFLFLYTLGFTALHYLSLFLKKQQSLSVQLGYCAILFMVFHQFRNVHYDIFTGSEYLVAFYLFIIIAFIIYHRQKKSIEHFKLHIAIALFALPFAGFFGSDNRPLLGLSHYMGFCLLLIMYLNHWLKISFVNYGLPVMLTGFLLYQILIDPYLNPSVFEQNKPANINGRQIYVSNTVYSKLQEFAKIKPYILADKPLIPIAVLNGILYSHNLTSFYTYQYNNVILNLGYIQLLLGINLPPNAQIIIYKDECNEYIQLRIQKLLSKASSEGLNAELVRETEHYVLYQLRH
jgi:hypothetical protein